MNITKKNSPNRYNGRNGWKPDMIVCHITEGSYNSAVSWLCNPAAEASAHFVVAKDGRITQLVDLKDGAWCNGTSTDPASKVYYGKSTLQAVRDRKTNANYYTVSIEHEGVWAESKGKLTDAQKAATIELIQYIRSEVKSIFGVDIPADRAHIVGHYEISPITKPHCPGENFPFDEIISAVCGGSSGPGPSMPTTGDFAVGDTVTVKTTATNYATGQSIASFVKGSSYTVIQVNNSNGTLLLGGINSWVYKSDVTKGEGSAPQPTADSFRVGQQVTVKTTATRYATGQNIADFVKGSTYTIIQLGEDRALLSEIISWVYLSDLETGSSGAVLKVGSKVKITGNTYATGQSIPDWVKNGVHTVSSISGDRALLGANGGICSWVYTKDLEIIE